MSGAGSVKQSLSMASGGQQRVLLGIGLVCLGVSLFPAMNAAVKLLGQTYPVSQIIWMRYLMHMIVMLALFMPARGLGLFRARRPAIQLLRSCLLLSSTAIYFYALQAIALPVAAIIQFTAPLIVTLLAIPILGERVGLRRWSAVVVGFAGTLLVIRPWNADTASSEYWASLLVLVTAVTYAFYQLMTRKVATSDTAETSIAWSALIGCIAVAPFAIPDFIWPKTLLDALLFVSLGLFGGVGHYFMTRGYAHGDAALLAPFMYVQIIGSVIFGYLVFGYFPDAWSWAGGAIIVSSGLFVAWREYILDRRRRPVLA